MDQIVQLKDRAWKNGFQKHGASTVDPRYR
jgi:hypothetical protein